MAVLSKLIYRFNIIPTRISADFFVENKITLKLIWKFKGPRITRTVLKKRKKIGTFTLPDSKSYCKSTVWYWHKDTYIEQKNRIGSTEINPCSYGQLTFDKGAKTIQWGKTHLFDKWR